MHKLTCACLYLSHSPFVCKNTISERGISSQKQSPVLDFWGGLFDISERKCVRHSGGPLISDLNLIGKFSNDLGIRSITLVSPESNARSNVSANYFHGGKRGTHKKICHNSKSPCSVRNPQSLGRKLKPQLACDSTIGLDRVDDPISPCFFPRARAGTNPCLTPGPKATHACQPY